MTNSRTSVFKNKPYERSNHELTLQPPAREGETGNLLWQYTLDSSSGSMSTRKIILLLLALCILLISPASGQITLDVDVPPGWALLDSAEEEDWG
jgi:hypothetical protein